MYSDLPLLFLQIKYEYAPSLIKCQESISAPLRSLPKTKFALINGIHIHKQTCKSGLKPICGAALHIPLCIHMWGISGALSWRFLHEATEESSRMFSSQPQPVLLLTPRPQFWQCSRQSPCLPGLQEETREELRGAEVLCKALPLSMPATVHQCRVLGRHCLRNSH